MNLDRGIINSEYDISADSLSGLGRLVWVTRSPGLADVLGAVHKEVLDNHLQHRDVAVGQLLLAALHHFLAKRGTVILTNSLLK